MTVVAILTLVFVISLGLKPIQPSFNFAEVKRRKNQRQIVRGQQYQRLQALLALLQVGLLLSVVIVASYQLSLWLVILYSLGLVILYVFIRPFIAKLSVSQRLYEKLEPKLLIVGKKLTKFSRWFKPDESLPKIGSKQDLLSVIEASPKALADDDLLRLKHSLGYADTKLNQVMIDWSDVETIDKDELLGPLRLDELHKTGYSQFPVLHKDSLVGLLDIAHLVTLKNKRSLTAGSSMSQVFTIKADLTVDAALREFSVNTQTVLVVTDSKKQPLGMLRLADTLELVTGQNYK